MTDYTELKRLAEAVSALEDSERTDELEEAKDALWVHMHCHTILDLIADLDEARNGMKFQPALRLKLEIDRLKAEVEALRTRLAKSPSVGFDWDAETTAMRKDAERYRWLNSQRSKVWKEIADVPMNETDQFIDAAMSKEAGLQKAAELPESAENKGAEGGHD